MNAYTIQASLDPKTNFGTNGGSGTLLRSTVHIIQSLEEMVIMGQYLGHNASVASLATQAQLSRKAVEGSWNATGGFYALSGAQWTLIDLAMIEINKIGSQERRDQAWSLLSSRVKPGGYVDPPIQDNFNLLDTGLHPIDVNVQGYLLWAAGERRDAPFAQDLIKRTYGPMVERGVNFTGAYWEFVVRWFHSEALSRAFADPSPPPSQSSDATYPGNDLQTALSHFWGGFPVCSSPFLRPRSMPIADELCRPLSSPSTCSAFSPSLPASRPSASLLSPAGRVIGFTVEFVSLDLVLPSHIGSS